jgi:glycosyltransferase involved in cell wall biosynthesis
MTDCENEVRYSQEQRSKSGRPIRALHIIQGKHFGGAEQVVFTLAKCFDRTQVEPEVVCLSDGLLLKKLAQERIPHQLIPMTTKSDILRPLLRTISYIRERGIDIVHTHTVRSNLIGRPAALLTRRKCITHLHSPILRDFADPKRGRLNELLDCLTRPIADCIIAVSHSLRQELLARGTKPSKVVTIHNGLDFEALYRSAEKGLAGADIRNEYSIPPKAFVLVLVALLRPRKGVHIAIESMKFILDRFPHTYLLIIGDDLISEQPGYAERLRESAVKLGIQSNVVFTGFRNDIPAILTRCDLMVLPALFGEGLPMVILESMAMGVPVVASRVEGIPEVIQDGETGFLVNPGNAGELSDRIIQVINNRHLLEAVRREGRIKMTDEMDGRGQARRVAELYGQILGFAHCTLGARS